jgi:hypothetical protein
LNYKSLFSSLCVFVRTKKIGKIWEERNQRNLREKSEKSVVRWVIRHKSFFISLFAARTYLTVTLFIESTGEE